MNVLIRENVLCDELVSEPIIPLRLSAFHARS
jgi:hypothetical protein